MLNLPAIRREFPLLQREVNGHPLVYLDNAASSQKPQCVIDALAHYYTEQNSNVHRGVHTLSQAATEAYEQARTRIAGFINAAHSHEVLFTKGTTDAINLVASAFGRRFVGRGDEIIVSTLEHHSNIVPWQMLCEQVGAVLKVAPINPAGELDLAAFTALLNRRTRLVALAHVSNALGSVNPVREVIELAHGNPGNSVPVLLDGAQAVPHMPVDVQALEVDFYAFSGHKVFGPTGVGVLYGKQALLNEMPPYQGGGEMIERVTFEHTSYNTLPHKFEAGTPNIAGSIGLGVGLDYFSRFDPAALRAHEQDLLDDATRQLLAIDGIKIIGTARHKVGVLSFVLADSHPFDVGTLLDQQGVAVRTGHHCTQPLMDFYQLSGTVRASFALYNNRADVEALVRAVGNAAGMLRR